MLQIFSFCKLTLILWKKEEDYDGKYLLYLFIFYIII